MRIRVVTATIALTAAALLGAAGTAAADPAPKDDRVAIPENSGSGLFWPGKDIWWPGTELFWPGTGET